MPAHRVLAPEKAPLLPAGAAQQRRTQRASRPSWARALLALLLVGTSVSLWQGGSLLAPALRPASSFSWLAAQLEAAASPASGNSDCPQQAPHVADYPTPIPDVDTYAERLSRAVQLDTSVGDNWPSPSDDNERWQTRFAPFRDFLQEAFPRAHAADGPVRRELVNGHALLYTWPGSDNSLKPILLTAHQDVVPVDPNTVDSWRFPPFSGHYENGTVWGRGSHDAKAWVIGIMSTLEALLDPVADFSPARTIIVGFGFDEEASGPHGGAHLAQALEERLGKDSVALLLDEGTPNFGKNDALGMPVAIVAVEEKGQAHISLRVDTPGGHSSGAPEHTSIGMLASILTAMEKAPEERRFPAGESAPLKQLLCTRHSPTMPDVVRRALRDLAWARRSSLDVNSASMSWLARAALALDRLTPTHGREKRIKRAEQRVLEVLPRRLANPLFTTRAIDIIHGGTKINALPEGVEASIDHRIATWSNVAAVKEMYRTLLRRAAKDFHLALEAFGEDLSGKADPAAPFLGKITVAEWAGSLEPAPRTPVVGKDAHAFRLLSSVIRDTYRVDDDGLPVTSGGEGVTVVPATMQGNTDTRYYWSLTRNIFRYGPASFAPDATGLGTGFGVHSVNEHFTADARLVNFYSHLIRLVDADREL